MSNQSFFPASFYEAMQYISVFMDQLSLFKAITEYALGGKEIPMGKTVQGLFILIKPLQDSNKIRRNNGSKGGRPAGKKRQPPSTDSNTGPDPESRAQKSPEQKNVPGGI